MDKLYKQKSLLLFHKLLPAIQKHKLSFIWVSAIAVGTLLPAALSLASGHTLVWRDTSKLFQPIRPLIVEALRNFQLPLWNPHEALGIPLFAQMMHGVLHPISVMGAFLFPQAGMDVFILIYIMLAALGSALLARILGASWGAAAITGFGYGLSGYVLGMGSIIQYLCAAASAPWALIGLRMAGENRRFGIVAAASAIAVLHFAGDPEWSIIAIILGIALAIEAGGRRGLIYALLGIAIGTALAGIQLIPTMAYFREASRAIELDPLDRMQWALAPWRIVEFIVPGFFGSPGIGLEKWSVFMWLGGLVRSGFEMPFVPSVFVGAGILVLAAAGLSHSRVTRIFGIASLILLWLALGTNAGAEQLLHYIPIWGKFRYSEKLVGPLTLCLSILAAFGADRLSNQPSRFRAVLAGAAGIACLLLSIFIANWQGFELFFLETAARDAAPSLRHNLATGLVHAALMLLAITCLIAAARRWHHVRVHFPAAAAGLVFLQLSLAAPFAMHTGERAVRDDHPLSQIANTGELPRIATPLERNYLYPAELNQFDAQIGVQSHMGVPSYNVPSHIDQLDTYTGLRPRRFELLLRTLSKEFGVQSVLALRRYAVTHMMIKNPYFEDETAVANAASAGGVKVLNNNEWGFSGWKVPHRPWTFFAEQMVIARGEKEALNTLVETLERGGSTVVLEDAPQSNELAAGQVLDIVRSSDALRIEATSRANGILVVNDSYWPGWRATIDGKDVPIWRADFIVRAMPWPAGHHVLEMKYDPPEVRIGWLISLLGAIALIAASVFELRRKRS
ncbi:MAG: YfhO family protein [Nitrospirae bacterium]|nr:YfhO family protein [Nitrospirota bacterium]